MVVLPLRRIFSSFPAGPPGLALLILRVVLGAALALEGATYWGDSSPTVAGSVVGLAALALGCLLAVGFLTPIAGLVTAAGAAAVGFSLLPLSPATLFDAAFPTTLSAAILAAVVLQGPGDFSVDARLFGRREIIIPLPPCDPDE